MKIAVVLGLLACTCIETSTAIFWWGTAATAATATTGTLTLTGSGATALALGGGLILIKGLALGALALAAANRNSRGRRAAEEINDADAAFGVLAATEPAQCYRRLICDLATGAMPKSENDVILTLFNKEASIASPKFEYNIAAVLGKQVKSIQMCEVRYSCPLSGADIQKLFH